MSSLLQNNFSYDLFTLDKVLMALKEINRIFRVGIVNSRWVSREHFQDWYIKLDFEAPKIHHTSREDNDGVLLNGEMDSKIEIGKRKQTDSSDSPKLKRFKKTSQKSAIKPKKKIGKHLEKNEDSDSCDSKEESDSSNVKNRSKEENDGSNVQSTSKEESDTDSNSSKEENANSKVKTISTTYFCPSPWISPDGALNLRILWRWAGAVLGYLISHPLINLSLLQQRFSYMTPFHIRILVEVMIFLSTHSTIYSLSASFLLDLLNIKVCILLSSFN